MVSEALYLADPDGNGLELYVDRPQGQWARRNGQIEMATDPLDVEGLLSEVDNETIPWTGVHPSTDVGHVHLHVSDLAQAEAFYSGLLGLNVTQRGYPGALFLSAGDYHHHLGVNVWAGVGAPSPPSDAVGLRSFALKLPNEETMCALHRRVQESGLGAGELHELRGANGILIHDPDGNSVELLVMKKQNSSSNEGVR